MTALQIWGWTYILVTFGVTWGVVLGVSSPSRALRLLTTLIVWTAVGVCVFAVLVS